MITTSYSSERFCSKHKYINESHLALANSSEFNIQNFDTVFASALLSNSGSAIYLVYEHCNIQNFDKGPAF